MLTPPLASSAPGRHVLPAVPAKLGDVLLLCADGLADVVDVQSLAAYPAADVGARVEHTVQAARRLESGDDITVVAARLG